jgi:hypothetical protein
VIAEGRRVAQIDQRALRKEAMALEMMGFGPGDFYPYTVTYT